MAWGQLSDRLNQVVVYATVIPYGVLGNRVAGRLRRDSARSRRLIGHVGTHGGTKPAAITLWRDFIAGQLNPGAC